MEKEVTIDDEGKGLEKNLHICGISAHYIDGVKTPQEFRFNFSGGNYTDSMLKLAMERIHNAFGHNYELNPNGGFTVTRTRKERQFIGLGNACKPLDDMHIKGNQELLQKCYLSFGLGADGYIVRNMDEIVHMLIAGTTGSGKSVLLNCLIMELLCYSNAQLLLIDPKNGAEFGIYENDRHNRIEHIAKDTPDALKWLQIAVDTMERRYRDMGQSGIKKYDGKKFIIVIDELADLMMTSKTKAEDLLVRLAQKGRAAGVHLIVATQDPRAKVVTGLIKYNLPTKICLTTANVQHSINVLDSGIAAQLLGKGDAYIKLPDSVQLYRIQCPNVSDKEIIRIIIN
ncbi:MAG: DUF87 domain-containing protein [Clostridiales bacterium]|nr:DUF87 domain-containing protein [Clostridiales bacterium]